MASDLRSWLLVSAANVTACRGDSACRRRRAIFQTASPNGFARAFYGVAPKAASRSFTGKAAKGARTPLPLTEKRLPDDHDSFGRLYLTKISRVELFANRRKLCLQCFPQPLAAPEKGATKGCASCFIILSAPKSLPIPNRDWNAFLTKYPAVLRRLKLALHGKIEPVRTVAASFWLGDNARCSKS